MVDGSEERLNDLLTQMLIHIDGLRELGLPNEAAVGMMVKELELVAGQSVEVVEDDISGWGGDELLEPVWDLYEDAEFIEDAVRTGPPSRRELVQIGSRLERMEGRIERVKGSLDVDTGDDSE